MAEDSEWRRGINVVGKINKTLEIKEDTVVSANTVSLVLKTIIVRIENKWSPVHPPSIFHDIPTSIVLFRPPSPPAPPLTIDRRNTLPVTQGILLTHLDR